MAPVYPTIGTPGNMIHPYTILPPWFMQPGAMHGYPPTPTPHHAGFAAPIPSSDPPDEDIGNPYPEIRPFFEKLDLKHPRRLLSKFAIEFEIKDFYHIDEIAKVSAERLSSEEFGISVGNALFILEEVKREMKHVDRARK